MAGAVPPALVGAADALGGAAGAGPNQPVRDSKPGATATASRIGQRLGPWRITRLLGSGGMGEVFEASRDDGRFQGQAAVKLLKRGMDSQAVLARFAQEQQALARLSHPHIARLLDAGLTDDGLPFFVMDRVAGRAIDQACAGLPLAQRLALFLQLCDAVAHAHRNLLVHRDLKPSNVLVDDDGRVKLLDFGIAKALDPLQGSADDAASATATAERPFTPHYASPEQVRGDPVSTATDIYSLGVLLYVLLTGQRPYGRSASTPAAAARSVLEEQPTRPSSLALPDPGWERTRRQLQGDLDNILLKALAKQPAERYPSVDALAADIQAYLDGRPVSARAASPGYVLAKWLGRHRGAALAGGLGGLGLLTGLAATLLQGRLALALGAVGLGGGLVLALVQAQRAQQARDEAARSRDDATRHLGELRRLANSLVFEVNDALERGLTEGRRQLVHAAAQSLERQAVFGQLTDADRLELGQALSRLARLEGHEFTPNLGNVPGALTQYERALQVLQPMAPRQADNAAWHGAMAAALEGRGAVLRTLRRAPEALEAMRRTVDHAARAATLAPDEMRWRAAEVSARVQLADHAYPFVRIQGVLALDEAREQAALAVACGERLVQWAPQQSRAWRMRAYSLRLKAGHQAISGQLADAVATEQQALVALQQAIDLPDGQALATTDLIPAWLRLAITLRAAGRYDEAAEVMDQALALAERRLRDDPGDEQIQRQYAAPVQTSLDLCLHRGDEARAAALHQRAQAALPPLPTDDLMGKRHWQQAWMDALQVVCWVRTGDLSPAFETLARLQRWQHDGTLPLRDHAGALDAELEANIAIAAAHVAAAQGRLDEARLQAHAACDRLAAMRALRDPRDAVEPVRAWQLLVRLAQAPWGDGPDGRALLAGLVAQARQAQAKLVTRGIVADGDRRESLWLAAQPAAG